MVYCIVLIWGHDWRGSLNCPHLLIREGSIVCVCTYSYWFIFFGLFSSTWIGSVQHCPPDWTSGPCVFIDLENRSQSLHHHYIITLIRCIWTHVPVAVFPSQWRNPYPLYTHHIPLHGPCEPSTCIWRHRRGNGVQYSHENSDQETPKATQHNTTHPPRQ